MKTLRILLSSLILIVSAPAGAVNIDPKTRMPCGLADQLQAMLPPLIRFGVDENAPNYQELADYAADLWFYDGPEISAAFRALVQEASDAGLPPPWRSFQQDATAHGASVIPAMKADVDKAWSTAILAGNHENLAHYGSQAQPLKARNVTVSTQAPVYLVVLPDGKRKIVRVIGENQNTRHTQLMSLLAEEMDLTNSPRSEIAQVTFDKPPALDQTGIEANARQHHLDVDPNTQGQTVTAVAVVTDFVEGENLFNAPVKAQEIMDAMAAKADRGSVLDAYGLEFLAGNTDDHINNFRITPDGRVVSYDAGESFSAGIFHVTTSPKYPLGRTFPMEYTESFARKLKAFTPDRIRELMGPHAAPEQLRGLLFRRALMLKDMELRPQVIVKGL